ncbi:MAG: peptidase S1 [Acidobacteria bacterium]|nr:MAG: peptidase S1 [Acidobacteriota bacterium]
MALEGFGQLAEQLRRSTVQVASSSADGRGQGSGIIIRSDGAIVTNAHVANPERSRRVAGHSRLVVRLWDGSSFPASLQVRNARRDLAVLQIPTTGLTPVTLANSENLRVGELVMAVGNPFGFIGAVTTGIVHAIGRRPGLGPTKWIQAEVQLAPGNSGGPLADARGNVVGVNTMVAGGLGLAVPSNAVARLLAGDLNQAPLGVVVHPAIVPVAGRKRLGLRILEVVRGSAAEYASLRQGDTLVGIEGQALRSLDDLEQAVEGGGDRLLRLEFVRDDPNKVRSVAVRLIVSQVADPERGRRAAMA